MSASKPTQYLTNPATKFFKWKGADDQGYFEYYDKNAPEGQRNVRVELDEFYICDKDLFCVTGYDEPNRMSIISNEVRSNIGDDAAAGILRVMGYVKDKKPVVLFVGTHVQLKENGLANAKYTKSIYIKYKGELCNIHLSGKAFSSWIEIDRKASDQVIRVSGVESGKKGAVKFKFPVFEVGSKATTEEWDEVIRIDSEILQPFLSEYLKKGSPKASEAVEAPAESDGFDSANWRSFKSPSGAILGSFSIIELEDLKEHLIDQGTTESKTYESVAHALYDIQQVRKTWVEKEDKAGRKLYDYSLEEIQAILAKASPVNPAKTILMVAEEAILIRRNSSEFSDDEEDDIPF